MKQWFDDEYYTGDCKTILERIGAEGLTKQEALNVLEDGELLSSLGFADKDTEAIENTYNFIQFDIIIDDVLEEIKELNNQNRSNEEC